MERKCSVLAQFAQLQHHLAVAFGTLIRPLRCSHDYLLANGASFEVY